MVIAYIRVSTNKQDTKTQKLQILEYAANSKIIIDEIIEVEISSRKSQEKRKINEIKDKLQKGDSLIMTEISRLGRSMLEVMNLVLELHERGIRVIFVNQMEMSNLSSENPLSKLILSIYGYLAEAERTFISERTKAGLAKARQNGKTLGRPFNSFSSVYHANLDEIKELIEKEVGLRSIWKILGKKTTYENFYYFCQRHVLKK